MQRVYKSALSWICGAFASALINGPGACLLDYDMTMLKLLKMGI